MSDVTGLTETSEGGLDVVNFYLEFLLNTTKASVELI
jgi:hypothetical protein